MKVLPKVNSNISTPMASCRECKYKNSYDENNMVFSFTKFQKNSVSNDKFNNNYRCLESCLLQLTRLFERLKEISNINAKKLNSNISLKRTHHYDDIKGKNGSIELIEEILHEKYGFPSEDILSFEKRYHEISFDNGGRIIGILRDGYIFECLFLDPNHMICSKDGEICRDYGEKLNYNFPCILDRKEIETKDLMNTLDKIDIIKILIENFEKDKISKEKFLIDIKNYL